MTDRFPTWRTHTHTTQCINSNTGELRERKSKDDGKAVDGKKQNVELRGKNPL